MLWLPARLLKHAAQRPVEVPTHTRTHAHARTRTPHTSGKPAHFTCGGGTEPTHTFDPFTQEHRHLAAANGPQKVPAA